MTALPNNPSFWRILDKVHATSRGDMEVKCERLEQALAELDDDQLRAFGSNFYASLNALYHWDLWGAAYILNGGCSDDSFSDFRATLLSMGESTCRAALADPSHLASVRFHENDCCFEDFEYAVGDALEDRFGNDFDRPPMPSEPAGSAWNEDEIEARFPRLCSLFELDDDAPAKPWWKFW